MISLNQLIEFVKFTHLFHHTERTARIPGFTRYANAVEHSYQLTLLAWYLITANSLPLDKDLAIKYALVHDTVEAYAGDTYFYDREAQKTKHSREEAARKKLARVFPEFSDLKELLDKYEAREDPESRFVYALDKLIDPLNIYLEDGKLWQEKQVTLPLLRELKNDKVASAKEVERYWKKLVTILEENEEFFFKK